MNSILVIQVIQILTILQLNNILFPKAVPLYVVIRILSLFIFSSLIFFFLEKSFIGALILIIYGGAIAILVIFLFMMINMEHGFDLPVLAAPQTHFRYTSNTLIKTQFFAKKPVFFSSTYFMFTNIFLIFIFCVFFILFKQLFWISFFSFV